jgi:hypothetical protein
LKPCDVELVHRTNKNGNSTSCTARNKKEIEEQQRESNPAPRIATEKTELARDSAQGKSCDSKSSSSQPKKRWQQDLVGRNENEKEKSAARYCPQTGERTEDRARWPGLSTCELNRQRDPAEAHRKSSPGGAENES